LLLSCPPLNIANTPPTTTAITTRVQTKPQKPLQTIPAPEMTRSGQERFVLTG
jgi:hypothetical protein